MDEALYKAWNAAQFLVGDLKAAHAIAPSEALEILLADMLEAAAKMSRRLERLARDCEGNPE